MSYPQKFQLLVNPEDPAVRQVLGTLLDGVPMRSKEYLLEAVVKRFKGFRHINRAGWKPFERILQDQAGNCLSLSCFLCSALRALQFTADEAFVCIFSRRYGHSTEMSQMPVSAPSHAFLLVRLLSSILCVNPNDMEVIKPKRLKLEEIQTGLNLEFGSRMWLLLLLFNDHRYRFLTMRPEALKELIFLDGIKI